MFKLSQRKLGFLGVAVGGLKLEPSKLGGVCTESKEVITFARRPISKDNNCKKQL